MNVLHVSDIFSDRKVRLVLGVIVMIAVARSLPYVSICWYYPIADHWGDGIAEVHFKDITHNDFFSNSQRLNGLLFFSLPKTPLPKLHFITPFNKF